MAISDSDLMVSEDISLSAAMQQMDKVRHKLLITTDSQNKVVGLITIGDIQRAIIAGNSLNISVKQFVRDDLLIARTTDDLSIIKEQMIRLRIEYMPVVNEENHLERIIYWETIIDSEAKHKNHSSSRRCRITVVICKPNQDNQCLCRSSQRSAHLSATKH